MGNVVNLVGAKFGRLAVVERFGNDACGSALWKCVCECGEVRVIPGTGLRAGRNKSCGCASPRFTTERSRTHGASRTRTYRIWAGMKARCADTKGPSAHLYALKGIRVCERWSSFENFFEDMGPAEWEGVTLDRIDGSKGYEPGNCRWATYLQQGNNTSANKRITYGGETRTIAEWARIVGIRQNTITWRLRRGWNEKEALTIPTQKRRKKTELSCLNDTISRMHKEFA